MKTCPICEKSWPSNHANCPSDGAMLIDSRELEPGTVIRGKYRIVRQLGRGGMGTVYLAEHILLNRQRALKFISSELSQDAAFLRRFRREAQAAIELRHPNVAEVVDLDQAEDGSPYIAMEYVDGPDLRHALSAGAFPVERALHIARGIALGLGAAHAKGIIHRDIKPENILLAGGHGKPETAKLLDFGIAAMKESATVASRTHGLLLTPPYAAPEQWKGMATEELDGRADLYALGGVLYEMLTGRTAFHAHNTEGWMYNHLHEQPQPPSHLRLDLANWPGLDDMVLCLLAKDREQRPRDAADLVRMFDALRPADFESRRETVKEAVATVVVRKTTEENPSESMPAEADSQDAVNGEITKSVSDRIWKGVLIGAGVFVLLIIGIGIYLKQSSQPSGPVPQTSPAAQPPYAEIEQKAGILFSQSRYTDARPLFEQACAGGNGEACNYLGVLYLDGFGVAKNSVKATDYYAKACNAGHSTGCLNLSSCYRDGTGVRKDIEKEKQYLNKACSLGDQTGCALLEKLSSPSSTIPSPQQEDSVSQSALAWTDPATGLMWAKKDNGSNVNWQQATEYCRNLQLAGHSDWRLPAIGELQGIYDPKADVASWHVKGNLQLTGWQWSSSPGNASGEAFYLFFSDGERGSDPFRKNYDKRALCVRGSGSNSAATLNTANPGPIKRTIISSGVAQGLLIQAPPPIYPPDAKAAGVSGMVELQIIISKTGSVDVHRVVSGNAMLQQAAIDAVKTWRYQPYMLDGKPVEVETMVNVAFTL
ncbi:MAG: TonB family protein [Terracidiphilus sp.]